MTLFQFNILALAVCCTLLTVGFAARERRGVPVALMLLGVVGLMALMVYNIHRLSY
ncbi:MAG: hypothetical protein QM740_09435 [Acidovorax sp.]